jgi:hypothetical protein
MKLWVRLLAAFGVIAIGCPSAILIVVAGMAVTGKLDPVGVALLACGVVGVASAILLYRVARGSAVGRRSLQLLAGGIVIATAGVVTGYRLLARSFDNMHASHLKSELRVLAAAQEEYFKEHGRFASDTAAVLKEIRYPDIRITIEHADDSLWRASASRPKATKRVCRATGSRSVPISDPVCD